MHYLKAIFKGHRSYCRITAWTHTYERFFYGDNINEHTIRILCML